MNEMAKLVQKYHQALINNYTSEQINDLQAEYLVLKKSDSEKYGHLPDSLEGAHYIALKEISKRI